jgi:hypothetical protein
MYAIFINHACYMHCLPHRHTFDRMTRAAQYKLYISSLGSSRQPSLIYSTLRPNILFNTVFCNTHISFLQYPTNKIHLLSQIIYSCKTLCMFRTVFPSIIRSSKLCIQQRYISGMRWNISSPITASSSSCLTYTVAVYAVWAPDDGRKDRPKHVGRFTRINDLR